MNFTIFLFVLFALQIICLIVGSRVARAIQSREDYFLAGKAVTFFPLLMTFVATQIGGGTVLGAAEEAYHYGWYVILYPMGCCLGFVLLAAGLGKKMYQYQVSTVAQIFEVAYKSPGLKRVASSLSMLSLFMIFAGQIIASKKFMISIGFDQDIVYAAFWTIVIVYTVMGGLQAVVATDVIQALFFIFVFFGSFLYALATPSLSFSEVLHQGLHGESFAFGQEKFCGWLLMPLLFMVIEQDMGQRCFAAKSPRALAWAAGCAAVCVLCVCIIPIYFGVLGKALGVSVANGSSVLMTVAQVTTSPVLSALMGCAVLAAIISTADSLINAISSNLTQDFELPILKENVTSSRIITTLIALSGIFVSYLFDNVVDLLILSYELSISCLFVSVLMAMLRGNGPKLAAIVSILCGGIGFFLFRHYPVMIPKEIASLLLSAIGYGVGCLLAFDYRIRERPNVDATG